MTWRPVSPAEKVAVSTAGFALAIILTCGTIGTAGAATVGADASSSGYQQGLADRDSWETWFNGLTGAESEGASYWTEERSRKTPVPCSAHASYGDDWLAGCTEAKRRLTPSDIKRRTDPQYWNGWNKVGVTPTASTATSPAPVLIEGAQEANRCATPYTVKHIMEWMNAPEPRNFGKPRVLSIYHVETIRSTDKTVVAACHGEFAFEGIDRPIKGTWFVQMYDDARGIGSETTFRLDTVQ